MATKANHPGRRRTDKPATVIRISQHNYTALRSIVKQIESESGQRASMNDALTRALTHDRQR